MYSNCQHSSVQLVLKKLTNFQKYFWITKELTCILIQWFQYFLRFEYLKSDKYFENCPKVAKVPYTNVSEETLARNLTLDTGISMKQILISDLFLVFPAESNQYQSRFISCSFYYQRR